MFLLPSPTPLPLDLLLKVVTSAGCGAIIWWLEQEQPSPTEQFAIWLNQFIYDISVSSLKLKGEQRLPIERNGQKE